MPGPRDYLARTEAALFALSGTTCYFPGCQTKVIAIIEGEPFINVQIAHIRSAKRDGPRYDESMSDDERRSWPNLVLLCKPHHELVDQRHSDRYPVQMLESWKITREDESGLRPGALSTMTEDDLAELVEEAVRRAGPIRKVEVELCLGIRAPDGMLSIPHAIFADWYKNNRDLGPPILIVTVRNAGALDAFVSAITLVSNPSGPSILSTNDYPQFNPALPFKVSAGESRGWMINLRQPYTLARAFELKRQNIESLQAKVDLGSGEIIESDHLPFSSLPERSLLP
jgi:hypothetical protein